MTKPRLAPIFDPYADVPPPPEPAAHRPPTVLATVALADVTPIRVTQATTSAALPVWPGMLTAIVGEGESGKTWIGAHTAADVAAAGGTVLVLDGEMSAAAWLRRLRALNADDDTLARIRYAEMTNSAADVALIRATVAALNARLVIWDSALSLISRTARSENDNAEVSRVYDRLRDIVRDGPAGLIVDHTTRGSGTLVSRGATAKFNALDVSYGVRLSEGSIPTTLEPWSSRISVEKDRHGLLGRRTDRTASFFPLTDGALHLDITELDNATHRLATDNPLAAAVAAIEALDPPPTSANDAARRVAGRKQTTLAAYRTWSAQQ